MKKKKTEKLSSEDIDEREQREPQETDDLGEQTDGSEESADALTDEEIEMLKKSIASAKVDRSKLPPHDTSDRATFLRLIKSNAVLTVAAIIVAAAIVLSAIGGTVFLVSKLLTYHRDFTVVIGDDEPYKVDYSDAVIDDVLYIDFRKIADHTGLTLSGSPTKMQFTSIKNGSYLLFEDESEYAYINGGRTEITATTVNEKRAVSAKAYVSETECLVPLSFLARTVSETTMSFFYDEETQTVYVRPKYFVYDGDVENRIMKELLFTTDNVEVTIPDGNRPTYTYSYQIDITPYLSSITAEHLMLVNKTSHAGKYEPSDLKVLSCPTTRQNLSLDYNAAVALEAMMLEMSEAGITETYVTSAYRSYDYQYDLYWGYVQDEKYKDGSITDEEAERRASEYSARPGESEHQTGLCFDFITADMGGNLNEKFEQTEAFEWLSDNAYKYGFILRYPKNKVETTGYKYEPWHYRFVGRQAASEIHFSGMCLEEYLEGQ